MTAYITLLGLLEHPKEDIALNFHIPADLNVDYLYNTIIIECGELEVRYSNPSIFLRMLNLWSFRRLPIWTKLYGTTQYNYDPIYNYDRKETYTDSEDVTENIADDTNITSTVKKDSSEDSADHGNINKDGSTSTSSKSILDEKTISSKTENTTTDQDSTSEDLKSAFNSVDYTPSSKKIVSENETNNFSGDVSTTVRGEPSNEASSSVKESSAEWHTRTVGQKEQVENEDAEKYKRSRGARIARSHTLRAYGNIGVTTTQQMIQAEREVLNYDIYKIIVDEFKMEFMILVY